MKPASSTSLSIRKLSTVSKLVVLSEPFLLIDGVLQNVDGVVSVKAARVAALPEGAAAEVHNFR
jgi:hypothetical protein